MACGSTLSPVRHINRTTASALGHGSASRGSCTPLRRRPQRAFSVQKCGVIRGGCASRDPQPEVRISPYINADAGQHFSGRRRSCRCPEFWIPRFLFAATVCSPSAPGPPGALRRGVSAVQTVNPGPRSASCLPAPVVAVSRPSNASADAGFPKAG